jgi:hypothetical protein
MSITDSVSALGYIFSIVQSPEGINASWSDCYMSLLVVFSKCLHLAFISCDSNERAAISGVHIMTNVMYLADEIILHDNISSVRRNQQYHTHHQTSISRIRGA